MAKKFVGAKTLEAFMQIVKTALGEKVDVSKVVANLESTDDTSVLAASQGKALKDMISAITGGGDGTSAAVLYKDLVTTLEGYNAETDAGKAVAVSLVKALNDQIEALGVVDGKVADADKLDGLDSTAFVKRTEVIDDWANYDENAQAAQVVAAALIKAVSDRVESLIVKGKDGSDITDADGNIVVKVAENAQKFGGQAPDYYAKADDLKSQVTDQKGQPSGIAPLGEDGKVPAEYLPSYVDDVIEGYLVVAGEGDATTRTFYEEEAHTTVITGEKGKIYIDLSTNSSWRWSGSTYVEVSGSQDMVEITPEEVEAIWAEVQAEAGTGA